MNRSILLLLLSLLLIPIVLISCCISPSPSFELNTNTATPTEIGESSSSSETNWIQVVINDEIISNGENLIISGTSNLQNSEVKITIKNLLIPSFPAKQYSTSITQGQYQIGIRTEIFDSGRYEVLVELPSGESDTVIFILEERGIATTSLPTPTSVQSGNSNYYQTYSWSYKGTTWSYELHIPKETYNYYKSKPHNRESNYAQYALSDYDRPFLEGIISKFEEASKDSKYSEYDTILNIISFVQSLPYTSDEVTTGYDEYPRYPIETLVDNGGDCEDTAILTAALLNSMGYGTVLIKLPHHLAVGVKCSDDYPGTYYEYHGSRYYYLETTGEGFEIGEIPREYQNERATIYPLIQVPKMDFSFSASVIDYDYYYYYYRVHCDIENIGSGTAKNPKMYIAALALTEGKDRIWVPDITIDLDDYSEGATGYAEGTLKIPRGEYTQIYCSLYGDNFDAIKLYSDTFYT